LDCQFRVAYGYQKFVIIAVDVELYRFLAQYGYEDRASLVPSRWLGQRAVSAKFELYGLGIYSSQFHQARGV